MKTGPNHIKVAEVISQRIPFHYLTVAKLAPSKQQYKRDLFRDQILRESGNAFMAVLKWIRDEKLTWEVETSVDDFCFASLYSKPDEENVLHLLVRDSTYGEVAVRLSCVCGAIVAGYL